MHYLFLLILLGFSVVTINGRPSQSEENNESQEELEYEEDNAPSAEDSLDDSQFGDEDSNSQDIERNRRLLELNRNNYLEKKIAKDQVPRTNLDDPDYKPTRNRDVRNDKFYEATNNNDEFQAYGKRRRYIETSDANEQSEVAQHFTNHDVNNIKNNRLHNEMLLKSPLKRTFSSKRAPNEVGELLFENNQNQASKVDKNEYVNEPVDINQRSSYMKQYYNQIRPDKAFIDFNSRDNDFSYYNRDRREAKKSHQVDAETISGVDSEKETLEKSDSESEEMAIKRHIKKMTGDELEQLLSSLSEENKSLLKKIMDDDDMSEKSYDSINKREITKKDGAIEENGYVESGQSESSKLQSGLSAFEITTAYPAAAQGSDPTTTKQTENLPDSTLLCNQQKSSQETNSENKADLNTNIDKNVEKSDNSFASNTDLHKNSEKIASNEQFIPKNENKREVNTETMAESGEDPKIESEDTKELRADDSYYVSQDEDMSRFLDDVEQSRSYDSSKIYKRNVDDQIELDSKMKSLEESFPNSGAYDDSGPYSGPLIRVKRKNAEQGMKKRSAAVLPDAKVGYYPYKSDNNDDDSDEGNEFDDDGFYDPAPNLVNNDNKNIGSNSGQAAKDASCKLNSADQSKSSINDGSMNLGSDTDNVLSGVEGVDENLMFSSGLRNRRKTDESFVERVDGNSLVQSEHSKTPIRETKIITTNNDLNVPNYQDNDSFGGFPRSYEGDLGRYKRIRRVKQSLVPEAPPST